MLRNWKPLLLAGGVLCNAPLMAQQKADSGAFIIRLGTDTVSVERYVRTGNRIVAEAAQRSPRTLLHTFTYELDARGGITRAEIVSRVPGDPQPSSRRVLEPTANAPAIPIAGPFYLPYELAIMQRLKTRAGGDSVALLAGQNIVRIPVTRVGADSVALTNQFGEAMRAHVDATGRLLHLHTPAFTTVERVPFLDIEQFGREFAARDAVGKGMGPLSPRRTFRARVGEANVWLDYSRPARRGRPIWGALVPYGKVWRMGANDAAHLATDKTIELGGLTLAPGTYTLYLLPEQNAWQLIVNRQTGVSGLDYDASQDVGRIKVTPNYVANASELFTLSIERDALIIAWDLLQASVPILVR